MRRVKPWIAYPVRCSNRGWSSNHFQALHTDFHVGSWMIKSPFRDGYVLMPMVILAHEWVSQITYLVGGLEHFNYFSIQLGM